MKQPNAKFTHFGEDFEVFWGKSSSLPAPRRLRRHPGRERPPYYCAIYSDVENDMIIRAYGNTLDEAKKNAKATFEAGPDE